MQLITFGFQAAHTDSYDHESRAHSDVALNRDLYARKKRQLGERIEHLVYNSGAWEQAEDENWDSDRLGWDTEEEFFITIDEKTDLISDH